MGYMTSFELTIIDGPKPTEELLAFDLIGEWSTVGQLCECGQDMKWYDYAPDMIRLSKSFPEYTFRLDGDGEESEDRWVLWARCGKAIHKVVEYVYPKLEPGDLPEAEKDENSKHLKELELELERAKQAVKDAMQKLRGSRGLDSWAKKE